ncbi:Wadjet anti-phage system protein JetD domain-containing protein [Ketobacter sp.]|mgnify:CR=1 FL=1
MAEVIPCFFWGDLDYSGLGILSSLRSKFIDMIAWKPAYDVMLQHLRNGTSHSVLSSNKGVQTDPGTTNCWYSDTVLLPAIRDKALFVDQEIVEFCEIEDCFISRE